MMSNALRNPTEELAEINNDEAMQITACYLISCPTFQHQLIEYMHRSRLTRDFALVLLCSEQSSLQHVADIMRNALLRFIYVKAKEYLNKNNSKPPSRILHHVDASPFLERILHFAGLEMTYHKPR